MMCQRFGKGCASGASNSQVIRNGQLRKRLSQMCVSHGMLLLSVAFGERFEHSINPPVYIVLCLKLGLGNV